MTALDPGDFAHDDEQRHAAEQEVPTDEPTEPTDPELADALEQEAASPSGYTPGLTEHLAEVITLLEPLDLEAAVAAIEEEPLPVEGRRQAMLNQADRAELVRAFLALQQTGRAIVRRLEDDAAGKDRDE